ncbi:hypothetical protein T09_8437 [Trichinella sp. T9]|nr:hypothetical protein T09_8437 [Trichinella sp. T9]
MKIDRMRQKKTPWGGLHPNNPSKAKRTVDILLLALYPFWLKRTKEVRPVKPIFQNDKLT